MAYEPHPIAELFPSMQDQEFAELAEDIRAQGLLEPIVLYEDKVLDGVHRQRACEQMGIEPRYVAWEGDGEPFAFVISKNLHRRHLNESQRAMIAARIANVERGDTLKKGSRPANSQDGNVTVPQAAKLLNVGERAVFNAKAVLRDGTPEEIEAVQSGEAAVSTVDKNIRKRKKGEAVNTQQTSSSHHGARVKVPDGMTLEELGRKGIELEKSGKNTGETAKALHMHFQTYQRLRDIINIADRTDLSEKNRALASGALEQVNATQTVKGPYEIVAHLVDLIYGKNRKGGRKRAGREYVASRHLNHFEQALGVVIRVCRDTSQIEIPFLGDRLEQVVKDLRDAEQALRKFRIKIEELHE